MAVVVLFIVKLLDPVAAIVALIGGALSLRWWHVAIAAVVAALAVEILLFSIQVSRTFNPMVFVIGIAGAAPWAALAFYLKSIWTQRSAKN